MSVCWTQINKNLMEKARKAYFDNAAKVRKDNNIDQLMITGAATHDQQVREIGTTGAIRQAERMGPGPYGSWKKNEVPDWDPDSLPPGLTPSMLVKLHEAHKANNSNLRNRVLNDAFIELYEACVDGSRSAFEGVR